MSLAIKLLEEIGQTKSIKQFSSLERMIEATDLDDKQVINLKSKENELIAFLLPEDDSEDNNNDDDSEE
jgi:hypothetical protein